MSNKFYLQQFEIVIDKIVAIQSLGQERRFQEIVENEGPFWFRDHVKERDWIIGRDGARAFSQVASKAITANKSIRGRVSEKTLEDAIKYQFCELVFRREQGLTESTASKVVAKAVRHVKKEKLQDWRHFFPAVLPTFDSVRTSFAIGPVEFQRTGEFLKALEPELNLYRERVRERSKASFLNPSPIDKAFGVKWDQSWPAVYIDKISKERKEFLEDSLRRDSWVATVPLQNFEYDRGAVVAERCVRFALDLLRVVAPPPFDRGLRLSDVHTNNPDLLRISVGGADRALAYTHKHGGDIKWESERFAKSVFEPPRTHWLDMGGSLLDHFVRTNELTSVGKRFFDAISWYGEAIGTQRNELSLVIYLNALEALFTTSSVNVTDQLCERVSMLLDSTDSDIDWREQVARLYNQRSRILHGEANFALGSADAHSKTAKELVNRVLRRGLYWAYYCAQRGDMRSNAGFRRNVDESLENYETALDLRPCRKAGV